MKPQSQKLGARALAAAACALAAVVAAQPAAAEEVNIYTDRQEVFLRPLTNEFTKQTGVKVNVLFLKKGLVERLQAEGKNSPADLIIALDAGRLQDFVDAGLVSAHNEASLQKLLAKGLSSPHWLALTRRARIIYAAPNSQIADYADLATPAGKGVCIRPATHLYNIGLFADLIQRWGEAKTEQWMSGVKANLARKPQGNDRAQIWGVINGECKAGVGNSYYYSKMAQDAETLQKLKAGVRIVIPPNAHINVTGAAVAANAPNRKNALALLRFLLGKEAQTLYAAKNGEFPARDDVDFPEQWKSFKALVTKAAPLANIARHRAAASRMVDKTGLNR